LGTDSECLPPLALSTKAAVSLAVSHFLPRVALILSVAHVFPDDFNPLIFPRVYDRHPGRSPNPMDLNFYIVEDNLV